MVKNEYQKLSDEFKPTVQSFLQDIQKDSDIIDTPFSDKVCDVVVDKIIDEFCPWVNDGNKYGEGDNFDSSEITRKLVEECLFAIASENVC